MEMPDVGIWLAVLGGMLLGETIIVLSLYWGERGTRRHVVAISASYLILVALGMQPALTEPLHPTAHVVLAAVAYLLGTWALWRLVPHDIHAHRERREVDRRGGGEPTTPGEDTGHG